MSRSALACGFRQWQFQGPAARAVPLTPNRGTVFSTSPIFAEIRKIEKRGHSWSRNRCGGIKVSTRDLTERLRLGDLLDSISQRHLTH